MRPMGVTFWNSTTYTMLAVTSVYMVYPCQSGVVYGISFADPIPYLKTISVSYGIPWDTRYDDFFTIPNGGIVGHLEGLEAFPCPALRVPKIFDSGVARIGNNVSLTHPQAPCQTQDGSRNAKERNCLGAWGTLRALSTRRGRGAC